MSKLSTFQIVLFAIFGLGALVGLFAFATYSGGSATKGIGAVTIWGTLPQSDMQAALSAAQQGNTALQQVTYVQKSAANLPNDLASAIATGKAPDLVLASQEELHSLAPYLGVIPYATISARAYQNTFISEGSLFTAPQQKGYYGIPFLVDPLVLFSNNAILSSDNIAQPPATWEALAGLVPNVAQLSSTQQVQRGLIALGTFSNVHDARGIISALLEQVGVSITAYNQAGQVRADLGLNSGGGVPPGEAVLRFYTQFADPSKVTYTWNASLPDSQQAFQNGDLALYLGYASEARYFTQANPNLSFTVSPFPQSSTATTKTTFGKLYAFMVPNGAANASGGLQAAIDLIQTKTDLAAASATGLAPAVRAALPGAPANDPVATVSYASALYADGWVSPAPQQTDQVFSTMINNVISGSATYQTALSTAESQLNAQL